jgi:hypothetical protein
MENNLIKDGRVYDIDRRLSKQYVALNFSGPLKTHNFAELSLRLRLAGTYSKVNDATDGEAKEVADYIDPELDQIMTSLGLFPLRTYPLRYTFGKLKTTDNRYEAGRRGDIQSVSPGLSVIRRYESRALLHSLQWRMAFPGGVSFGTEAKHEESEIIRQYDFEENRDIWIVFTSSQRVPTPTHNVDVVNSLDDEVLLYIDLALVDTLSAGELLSLDIAKGVHEIDLVPTRFNRFNTTVDVQSSMQWRIVFTPPKGSSDLDQKNNSIEGILKTSEDRRFRNETRFLLSDMNEDVQGMTASLGSVNNQASYNVRQGLDLNLLTTWASTNTNIRDISSQKIGSLLHQTEGRWRKRGGASALLSHSFNSMNSETFGDRLKSNTNVINAIGSIPTRWAGHVLDLRSTTTLVSDNKGYANNQYMAGFGNKIEVRPGRFRLKPQHEMKFTRASVENAGIASTSNETESRLRLDGERTRMAWFNSDVRLKSEWEWRNRDTETETETKNRFFAELGVMVNFSKRLRVMGAISQESESYDTEAKISTDSHLRVTVRPDRRRRQYRLDVQTQPTDALTFGANGMLIDQDESRITRLSMSLSGALPLIGLPVRSFLVSESKTLEGLADQSLLQMEISTSHRYRQISIIFAYSLFSEKLATEDYTYSEFYVKISRAFEVM